MTAIPWRVPYPLDMDFFTTLFNGEAIVREYGATVREYDLKVRDGEDLDEVG